MTEEGMGGLALQPGPGFVQVEELDTPFRLAFGHVKSPNSPVWIANADGSEKREVLPGRDSSIRTGRGVWFTADGSRLFCFSDASFTLDLRTGARSELVLPTDDAWNEIDCIGCSPDGTELFLTLTKMARDWKYQIDASQVVKWSPTNGLLSRLYEGPAGNWITLSDTRVRGDRLFLMEYDAEMRPTLVRIDTRTGQYESFALLPDFHNCWDVDSAGREVVWSKDGKPGLQITTLPELNTRSLLPFGEGAQWSPDGSRIAFLDDQHRICCCSADGSNVEVIIEFRGPCLSHNNRKFSYGVEPCWSPDGQMLWFVVACAIRLPRPRSLREAMARLRGRVRPFFHNLNPRRECWMVAPPNHYDILYSGVADIVRRKVLLRRAYHYGVTWLGPVKD